MGNISGGDVQIMEVGKSRVYAIKKVPDTFDEFMKLRKKYAKDPFGGVALLIVAFLKWSEDIKKGKKFLTSILDFSMLEENTSEPDNINGYYISQKEYASYERIIGGKDWWNVWPKSYALGQKNNTPEKNWNFDPKKKFEIHIYQQGSDKLNKEGKIRLFVRPYGKGANEGYPIHLQKNDAGIFKVTSYTSCCMHGCKIIKKKPKDMV